ncbi:MAG: 50S ribosomal protein L21 [Candidatus Cloacimonetes bacterium]|nr:50S ribosomal protein L21 [Candidatus Cloacimonadota bacterium]
MYAIVEFKGSQYRVEKDQVLKVAYLGEEVEPGTELAIERVLMFKDDSGIKIGHPLVESSRVMCEVVSHGRDKKVIVFKKKRRKGYQKKQGHRQHFTMIKVKEILN